MLSPAPPPRGSRKAKVMRAFVRLHVRIYRLTRGRLGGRFSRMPLLLLDHQGRRSGARRTTPLAYYRNGDDLLVVVSNGGGSWEPDWWLNLRANPATTVQVRREKRTVVARAAGPEERAELWPLIVKTMPDFDAYQRRTHRQFDVVVLEPAAR